MASVSTQAVVMVAERAVQQSMGNLRDEVGGKIQTVENGLQVIENGVVSFKAEVEKATEDLNGNLTNAFKANNATLRQGIKSEVKMDG